MKYVYETTESVTASLSSAIITHCVILSLADTTSVHPSRRYEVACRHDGGRSRGNRCEGRPNQAMTPHIPKPLPSRPEGVGALPETAN